MHGLILRCYIKVNYTFNNARLLLYGIFLLGSVVDQSDETYFGESFKENHSKDGFIMLRKSHRRETTAKFRGISKMQVCVLTALDSNKNIVIEPSCMGRPGSSDLLRVLGSVIKKIVFL